MAIYKPSPSATFAFLLFGTALSCSGPKEDTSTVAAAASHVAVEQPDRVQTLVLRDTVFPQELIANGKLKAPLQANLRFQTDGTIRSVTVREGQQVAEGAILAELDDAETQMALKQSELDHRRALLDYEDQLLRQGYRLADTANLDADTKAVAHLRSGLSAAVIALDRAKSNLARTRLKAPFPGTIANMKARPFNAASAFEYICTLVDNRALLVEFKVLDQELPFIRGSRTVAVSAFSDPDALHVGEIVSVNPLVDESGMVSIKAQLNGKSGLLDGMAVRVVSRRTIPGQLAVPKEAVLDRQGRKVVFTFVDGFAKWNYVEIGYENSTHYTINSGLKGGDEVIHGGNFNLAHDKPVVREDM